MGSGFISFEKRIYLVGGYLHTVMDFSQFYRSCRGRFRLNFYFRFGRRWQLLFMFRRRRNHRLRFRGLFGLGCGWRLRSMFRLGRRQLYHRLLCFQFWLWFRRFCRRFRGGFRFLLWFRFTCDFRLLLRCRLRRGFRVIYGSVNRLYRRFGSWFGFRLLFGVTFRFIFRLQLPLAFRLSRPRSEASLFLEFLECLIYLFIGSRYKRIPAPLTCPVFRP